jgi:L-lactate dehydrogenase complex protein LldG
VSAREEMLAAVRTAFGPEPRAATEVPRDYRAAGTVPAGSPDLVELFCERVGDYKADVHRVSGTDELAAALAEVCAARGSSRVLRAPAADWDIDGADVRADSPDLSPPELDTVDAALTGCALAIAETGTIVLDGAPRSGRRALTLVPDHHICVVRADQVVANLPDAIAHLADAARAGRPLTFVSGPSATSDIELQRVEGVHGPRMLDVVVLTALASLPWQE